MHLNSPSAPGPLHWTPSPRGATSAVGPLLPPAGPAAPRTLTECSLEALCPHDGTGGPETHLPLTQVLTEGSQSAATRWRPAGVRAETQKLSSAGMVEQLRRVPGLSRAKKGDRAFEVKEQARGKERPELRYVLSSPAARSAISGLKARVPWETQLPRSRTRLLSQKLLSHKFWGDTHTHTCTVKSEKYRFIFVGFKLKESVMCSTGVLCNMYSFLL